MFELAVILLLVLINALLSGTEMAVVSARRARLQSMADLGSRRAQAVLRLRHSPERFLATVQVGITLVGAIAAAFGGSSLTAVLAPWLAELPGCATIADDLAFGVVVVLITFLSVVFGELIPKSLALRNAEPMALVMARPVLLLQFLARPLVWLLVRSSNLALRPFHDSTNFMESKLTREDLVAMVTEASGQSDLPPEAKEVLERAIDFAGLRVADVMVPRRWMVALPKNASEGALREALLETGHRRVPIYDGTLDAMNGYVLREDVMALLWDRKPIDIAALLRPCYFVPDTMTATKALREMQARRLHLGIVVEETGSIAGIVTLEDLIEELVGEIFHERDVQVPEEAKMESAGAWLAPGRLGVRDFVRLAKVDLGAPDEVRTLGGLMVHLAGGTLPAQGAVLEAAPGITLEAVEVSVRRVRLVRARIDRQAVPAPR